MTPKITSRLLSTRSRVKTVLATVNIERIT